MSVREGERKVEVVVPEQAREADVPYGGADGDDEDSVQIKKSDLHKMLAAMDEAGDVLSGKNMELAKRLKKHTGSQYAEKIGFQRVSTAHRPLHRSGYSLGQTVEVRYIIDDIVNWEQARVVTGSGGGLYSLEFANGEIWDKIPGDDLRPCETFITNPSATPISGGTAGSSGGQRRTKGSWNLATKTDHMMFNGWMWMEASQWMRSKGKVWAMLLGTKFYYGDAPNCDDWEMHDLLFATVQARPNMTINISNTRVDYNLTVSFENGYEYLVWLKQLETGVLRAEKSPDYTKIVELENELIGTLKRPVLPMFEPKAIVEKAHVTTVCGYVVTSLGSTWLGAKDWKRRWVTLHLNWLCIRPDKSKPDQTEVIPLRESKCWSKPIPAHPHTLEITGTFITPKLLNFDNEEDYNEWKTAISTAIFTSNPEDLTSDKIRDSSAAHRGIS